MFKEHKELGASDDQSLQERCKKKKVRREGDSSRGWVHRHLICRIFCTVPLPSSSDFLAMFRFTVLLISLLIICPSSAGFLNRGLRSQLRSKNNDVKSLSESRGPSSSRSSFQMVASTDSDLVKEGVVVGKSSPPMQYALSTPQLIYVVLTSVFVTCLLIADVIGVKLFEIPLPFEILGHKTVEHTCGMLTFPITFLLGDTINEYYGAKATKQTVYIGLAMSVLTFIVMNVAQAMPYLDKPFNVTPESFNMIFGSAKLMYVASVFAYLLGQLTDIWLFGVIKKITKGELLWLRATGSTVISQMLDSFVVSYIAFSLGKSLTGQTPATPDEVFNIAVTGYGLKFAISVALTPALYYLRSVMQNKFGLEPVPLDQEE